MCVSNCLIMNACFSGKLIFKVGICVKNGGLLKKLRFDCVTI